MDPKDEDELQDMMFTALQQAGPSAIRYPRGMGPGAVVKEQPVALAIGVAEGLKDGSDVAIFALGNMVAEAEKLAKLLEREGQSVAVINARFAKPLDAACVAKYGKRCGLLITMEDHVLAGGFGSAVLESLNAQEIDVPVVRVGWPDEFIEHGKPDELRAKYGLTPQAAFERAKPYLKKAVAV
jgi:1-deoxy-D-xylulose-5-phosphate synthase